jgi:hypothetical protein
MAASRHAFRRFAVYATALTAAAGSPSSVLRSDCSTTVAISRRKPSLFHQAVTARNPDIFSPSYSPEGG